jgi:hypothetical protein
MMLRIIMVRHMISSVMMKTIHIMNITASTTTPESVVPES